MGKALKERANTVSRIRKREKESIIQEVNMFLQPTALVVWLLLRLLLMVFVGPALPARSARAPPDTVSAKRELRVLVLLPEKSGENKFPFGSEMCGAAVLKALEDIEQEELLPGYTIKADFANSGCNALLGIGRAHQMFHRHRYQVLFGPACSGVCRFVGRLAAFLNIPVFSGVCQGNEMHNKKDFKTLTRFLATFEMTGFALSNFLLDFGWRRVGIIAETYGDIIWILTKNGLQYAMERTNITIASNRVVRADEVERALVETAKVTRIIILAMHGDTFRRAMVVAHEYGFHKGEYIFVSIPYYELRKTFGDFSWRHGDGLDHIVKAVYPAVFFFWYSNRGVTVEQTSFQQYVRNQSASKFDYHYAADDEVPYPAANLYEAAILYALAANETLEEGGDINDGILVSQRLWNRSFPSLTGGVTLNSNGDREQAYLVTHMQDPQLGTVKAIGTYFSSNTSLYLMTPEILWPGGLTAPPPDTPTCGFDGERCREDPYAKLSRIIGIFSGTLIATVVVSVAVVVFVYRRLEWERAIADMKWKINMDDVVMNRGVGVSRLTISRASVRTIASKDSAGSTGQKYTLIGIFKGITVALKHISRAMEIDLSDKNFLSKMKRLYDVNHPNLARFIGASVAPGKIYILTEYCAKGSLQDVLENDDIQLDWSFRCSLMFDIIEGLHFLHESHFRCHGNLKSSNCLVDGRFVVKLTDFGLPEWHADPDKQANDFLWTAPEFLHLPRPGLADNSKGDIYSFGVVLQEIVAREGPFFVCDTSVGAEGKVERVRARDDPPFRPNTSGLDCPSSVTELMTTCWSDLPSDRPALQEVKAVVKAASGTKGKSLNIFDMLLSRMEQYANNLENLVEERTGKYLDEKKRAEDLLHRLLPSSVAEELQLRGQVDPVTFEEVTIYFSDIVEFTPLCSESSPLQVVNLLNDLYICFDEIIAQYDVYKVETIGDAYMAVSGLPTPNGRLHAREVCLMSLDLLASVSTFRIRHRPDQRLLLRIGIHSGPCVAGVVGLTMPRYCLFGDTVNTAARMESNGQALKIHLSPDTEQLLQALGGFLVEARGISMIKGKGPMETFWLLGGPNNKTENKA